MLAAAASAEGPMKREIGRCVMTKAVWRRFQAARENSILSNVLMFDIFLEFLFLFVVVVVVVVVYFSKSFFLYIKQQHLFLVFQEMRFRSILNKATKIFKSQKGNNLK